MSTSVEHLSLWFVTTIHSPMYEGRIELKLSTFYFHQRNVLIKSYCFLRWSPCFSGVACSLPFLHLTNPIYPLKSGLECEGISQRDFFQEKQETHPCSSHTEEIPLRQTSLHWDSRHPLSRTGCTVFQGYVSSQISAAHHRKLAFLLQKHVQSERAVAGHGLWGRVLVELCPAQALRDQPDGSSACPSSAAERPESGSRTVVLSLPQPSSDTSHFSHSIGWNQSHGPF